MREHPFIYQMRMTQQREDIARGLAEKAKTPEGRAEIDAIFARVDASVARVDAVKAGDWKKYVELGGDVEIARKADPLSFPLGLEDMD